MSKKKIIGDKRDNETLLELQKLQERYSPKEVTIIIRNGEIITPWYHPSLDPFLEKLGLNEKDPNRSKFCG